jgi:hypothetical protein
VNKKFTRTIEDFKCEHCGGEVSGNGYTNHCPECLWSKHVDINPGDRKASCKGLMKPIGIETVAGEHKIVHECVNCGFSKKNKTVKEDNFKEIIKISNERSKLL